MMLQRQRGDGAPGQGAVTELVLVGGGHVHVEVLRRFGLAPEPGVRLTLITPDVATPYSGMLPGFIAGHYTYDDIHIDLRPLARAARARLVLGAAIGIDRAARCVRLADGGSVSYDVLSLDIGIAPDQSGIRDTARRAVAVKPVSTFAARWRETEARALAGEGPRRFVVAGGGVAGVEIVLAAAHRLRARAPAAGRDAAAFSFTLVAGGALLPSGNAAARRLARRALATRGVTLIEHAPLVEVGEHGCRLADGRVVAADAVLLTTGAIAASWLAASGLPTLAGGFLSVRPTLQLEDDDDIFAAGDCATVHADPRPKAGVFAVRQGPPLADNLRRRARGLATLPFTPQRQFLGILALGDREAIAMRGRWAVGGGWVWRWKDRIDRAFMARYRGPAD